MVWLGGKELGLAYTNPQGRCSGITDDIAVNDIANAAEELADSAEDYCYI